MTSKTREDEPMTNQDAKHTPGPWKAGISIVSVGDRCICQMECEGLPHKANARLIAAAPKLLEAAKGAQAAFANIRKFAFNGSKLQTSVEVNLDKAIAKAEGR